LKGEGRGKMSKQQVQKIRERIMSSLGIRHAKSDREFWKGFVTGLFDYHVIERKDFAQLYFEIQTTKNERRPRSKKQRRTALS